ncbi:hypothetical protein PM8797T_08014 [Gimesia maris DSM 8797]|nr:hypothetical protein PM8797T_08014 [Gimesia maris DSM 8797]
MKAGFVKKPAAPLRDNRLEEEIQISYMQMIKL